MRCHVERSGAESRHPLAITAQTILPIFQKIHEISGQKVMLDFVLRSERAIEVNIAIIGFNI
ncbi:MAG: hypothetical protein FWE63_00245 [Bacteroidales bacterium]|nr:hypothetical protein [Bacteroidales bacterium]